MPLSRSPVSDGTTGRTARGGRRTHIIQLLRDSRSPLSVDQVAESTGIHINTARFHLESLVDSGLAERQTEARTQPGRPKVVYRGTLPNQTHERAQGYRLLAEMLTTAVAQSDPNAAQWMYQVGQEWGRYLTTRPAPFEEVDEESIDQRLVDKLDALWFAPELVERDSQPPCLMLHNCPFLAAAERYPEVVCQLHAGMINGSLDEMRSAYRLVGLQPQIEPLLCLGELGPAPEVPLKQVPLDRSAAAAAPAGGGVPEPAALDKDAA
ncbi:MAG: helix-turn-helix domain-containing protein [Bifidobacteriaceae bacterium]|jgi:predicted ArsR family transcriptional regulator|nr:helix-turn-helix domain-containing protein [Bifidobacteriaceae bacterium]